MRQRKVRVRRYTDSNRPHLKFVVNYREMGKRKRSFFETKEQAGSFAAFKNAELKRNGVEHAEFPTSLRVMAQECGARLSEYKKTGSDSPLTIKDATDYLIAHLQATAKSCNASELVDELIAAKKADGASQRNRKRLSGTGIFLQQPRKRSFHSWRDEKKARAQKVNAPAVEIRPSYHSTDFGSEGWGFESLQARH